MLYRREGAAEPQQDSTASESEVGSGSGMDENVMAQKLAENLALNSPITKLSKKNGRFSIDNQKRTKISHPTKKKRTIHKKLKSKVEKTAVKSEITNSSNTADEIKNATVAETISNSTEINSDIAKEVEEKFHVTPNVGMHLRCKVPGKSTPMTGQLRFLGHITNLPKRNNVIVAGLELDHTEDLGTDGTFLGKRYFTASVKKGYFVPVKNCSPI